MANFDKIDFIKVIIEDRIKQLSGRSFDRNIDFDGDDTDEVQGIFILNMAYESNDRNNQELASLYTAMKKIEVGEYGICEECDNDIDFKRLTVCPGTRYCIKCAELMEKEARAYRR